MNTVSEEFTGRTSQEAVEEGLKALGISREEAEIEIVEEAKKGFFGIGATKARVKIRKKEEKQEEEKREEAPSDETQKEIESPAKSDTERTAEFLRGLFDIMNIDAKIGEISEGEKIVVNLETENYSGLIGRKGEIIDAVQTLAGAVANIGKEKYKRVVVDCHNYREIREEKLQNLARKFADKAVALGRKIKLDPMNPYERRIIHSTLSDNPDVKTQSEGKEPNRHVVIIPNNLKPYEKRNNGRKPYNKDARPYDKEKKSSFERSGEGKPYEKKPYNKNGKYDKNRKNYSDKAPSGGTGTGSYVKKEGYKRNYSSFVGTYLGNSRTDVSSDETKEETKEESDE